jgi:NAD(P)H dehydrogenase (quinone)
MPPVNATVIYYSATGTVHALAQAAAEAAEKAGARVRLRKAGELAPQSAIGSNPAWVQHRRSPPPRPRTEVKRLPCSP